MIYIQKKPSREAVDALRRFVKAEGVKALYDNFKQSDGKAHLQESLAAEQYYLCAYCMRRIHRAEKIEHWITRDTSKKSGKLYETVDYDNMLAVCNGVSTNGLIRYQHCDQSRSKKYPYLVVNPIVKATIDQIRYLRNGKIYSEHPEINKNLDHNQHLNLNNLSLMDNRRRVYEAVKKSIDIACRGKSEVMSEAIIRKIVSSWKEPCYNEGRQREELKEFCGIILSRFSRFG